jgi:hypothetical protein
MRWFQTPQDDVRDQEMIGFAAGALGGVVLGLLLSRVLPESAGIGRELREGAGSLARRLRPGRLHRLAGEQEELYRLEDAVLDAFLGDEVLSERGVDIGAVSPGIVELSGAVWTEDEARGAVALASRIPGVRTVVNRLEVEDMGRRPTPRRPLDEEDLDATFAHQEGRVGGMGRRRQSPATEPDRPDDSQYRKERALAAADRDQWADEGFSSRRPRTDARDEVQSADRTGFRDQELDNQDPHGRNAKLTLDAPPEDLDSDDRVGEGTKPGLEAGRTGGSDTPSEPPSQRDRDR